MAGTYRKLKNGKWELCVNLGTDLQGKRIRKYKYVDADGPRPVEKMLAEFVAECTKADYNDGERMTLKDYSALWMADYAEKELRQRTLDRYKSILPRINTSLGHKKLGELKPTHLIEFFNMLREDGIREDGKPGGLSWQTIKHHHTVLSSMLSCAVQWQIIKENICSRVTPPKPTAEEKKKKAERTDRIYSIDQTKGLLKSLSNTELKYRVLVLLAVFTGFRRSELMGLEWSDVNFRDNSITLNRTSLYTVESGVFEDETKTPKSKRAVYLPDFIMKLLRDYRIRLDKQRTAYGLGWVDTNRLFVQESGKPMHPDTPSSWFPKFLRKNELSEIRFHDLRHIHGSILLAMGMDMNSVADQMGHADTQMLIKTYGHNVRKKPKEVAEHLVKALINKDSDEMAE